ncbi:MAG TPA: GFA family protein [Arenicellales bacterium]|nr:GFA family protein [Arenicellales bacterium]
MIHRGSCLCGEVRYEIHGELLDVLNCHCSMCRKFHGAAFRTRAAVRAGDFHWLAGEHLLTRYESSPGEYKTFCSVCGSSMVTMFDHQPDWYGFPLGTLDTDPGVKPARHIYVGSKAPWHDISDDLPQYEGAPD